MINCQCQRIKPITKCSGQIEIGTISDANEDVYVWYQDNANGRLDRVESSSDGSGKITFNPDNLMPGRDYDIWITKRTATQIKAYEPIDIAGDSAEYDCLTFEVHKAYAGAELTTQNQTLTV